MLLLVVALVTGLGLMVSLARWVRREGLRDLAERVLLELEASLAAYEQEHDAAPANVPGLLPPGVADTLDVREDDLEARLTPRALANAEATVQALRPYLRPAGRRANADSERAVLDTVGSVLFDGRTVRDPWGTPIVYFARGSILIGQAAQQRPFFVSAGRDGRFLTRADNLYSYELRRFPPPPPTADGEVDSP